MMYQPGELIVYGRTGVCRVQGIEQQKSGQDFYVLEAMYQNCSIRTPVEGKVFMRPVISKEEADALIDMMPSIEVAPQESLALRELTEHYQASIATHKCEDLIELIMSIYAKKRAAERDKRKFGAVDERFMKEGEALLYGELAVALDLTMEEVPGYISHRLQEVKAANASRETAVEV